LKFEGRSARNFADWLRTDRETNPIQIDGEIAYKAEFVRGCLRKRLARIEKSYPDSFRYVSEFVAGADLGSLLVKDIIETAIDAEKQKEHDKQDTIETGDADIETTDIGSPVTQQTERETEPETEQDVRTNPVIDRSVSPERMETQTIRNRPEHETVPELHSISNTPTGSKFRQTLTNPETMLWGTVAVIFVFLPFTVLNLYQYINIETNSIWGDWGVFLLCCGIAFVWDFSILLFAVNGKHRISQIGAGVLFVFMASKFDFFKRIFDLFGANGDWWQLMFVLSAIVLYSPVLIHQYTKLSVKDESK
jgi:hypothetical protein